ncbi:AarF/UbiB family protein [Bacillus sp. JJ1562]|uniref:AarF/UbiB family protein n=1 Tax=Bacillus sp. JJ1562 TaxID=3122960 RepID=UPI003003509D
MKDIKGIDKIGISKIGDSEVSVDNPTNYPLIGKGKHGAVFKLSSKKCVKVFYRDGLAKKESDVYKNVGESNLLPRIYQVGDNYIVMEYIPGRSLNDMILDEEVEQLPSSIVKKVIEMMKEMKRLGFSRLDVTASHLIITAKGDFKLIDHENSMSKHQPYPARLFNRLRRYNKLQSFLKQVRDIDKSIYLEWKALAPDYFEIQKGKSN